jgi:hypothetical protein
MTKIKTILALSILVLAMLACNALIPPPSAPILELRTSVPNASPTESIPLSEAGVPRVNVKDAKTAFDNETAIFIDVRSEQAYNLSHIPGALSIQLGEFETNPTELGLPKDQWIITYCT